MGASYSKICLLVGRLIVGLGIGMASMSVPVYIAEIAPNHMRGALVTLNTVFITAGQVIAAIVDAIFISDEVNGWRYMLGIGGVPSFIQLFAFIFMPESPRWLVQRGQISKARATLQRIYGASAATPQIESEIQRMIEASSKVQVCETPQTSPDIDPNVCMGSFSGGNSSVSENTLSQNVLNKSDDHIIKGTEPNRFWSQLTLVRMLRFKPTRRALFIGCSLQMFQQFVGINTVMYYSAEILSMAGIGGTGSSKKEGNMKIAWLTALVASTNFLFSLGAPWIVGRFKRRLVFYCSLTGVFISLIILAVSFQLIASYSAHVSVIETIPLENIYASCLNAKTCDMCIQQKSCGFCYETYLSGQTKVPVNGSCLPSPKEFSPFSAYGRCSEKSMEKEHVNWAFDHCPNPYGWMTLFGLILYLASFAPGMSPLPWTINAEIYPSWARSTGVATATAFNWIANLIVSFTFLSLTSSITRQGAYFLYAGVSVLAIIFVWRFVPEHGNKSLEEIEITLGRS
ncbi:unnamed protein product [Trichobilharzia szidati]|nr:unnamed protein product [Trichobilharzia szidati]